MLKEEEKQLLKRIVEENPEKAKIQKELQALFDSMLDGIIKREETQSESNA